MGTPEVPSSASSTDPAPLGEVEASKTPASRESVLSSLDAEIQECDKRAQRLGVTTWVIIAALAFCLWKLLDISESSSLRWSHVALALSVIVWIPQSIFPLWAIRGVSAPVPTAEPSKFDDAKDQLARTRAIFLLDVQMLVMLAIGLLLCMRSLPPGATIVGIAGHMGSALLVLHSQRKQGQRKSKVHRGDFGMRPLEKGGRIAAIAAATARFAGLVYFVSILLAEEFSTDSARTTLLLATGQALLYVIAFLSPDWSLRDELIDLRRDLCLGEISAEYAMVRMRELFLGTPLDTVWADLAFSCNQLSNSIDDRLRSLDQLLGALCKEYPAGPSPEPSIAILLESTWQRMAALDREIQGSLNRSNTEVQSLKTHLTTVQQSPADAAAFGQRLRDLEQGFEMWKVWHRQLVAKALAWRDTKAPTHPATSDSSSGTEASPHSSLPIQEVSAKPNRALEILTPTSTSPLPAAASGT